MENESYIIKNKIKKLKINNKENAQKSLNNYVNQLKLHFDLTNEDIVDIFKVITEYYKINNKNLKKWWHIWK